MYEKEAVISTKPETHFVQVITEKQRKKKEIQRGNKGG
jgi:hypothetical protein